MLGNERRPELEPFAHRLSALMEAAGTTQSGLAASIGVTERAVSFWCNAKREPHMRVFMRMCESLGCTPEQLCDGCAPREASLAFVPFSDTLGSMLKSSGVSRSELARRVGVTRAAVMLWLRGTSEPSLGNVVRICKALGCTPNELLMGRS